ncbi:MAG: hypothetical protein ACYDDF_05265 [Thermoplasmatota archaeon]
MVQVTGGSADTPDRRAQLSEHEKEILRVIEGKGEACLSDLQEVTGNAVSYASLNRAVRSLVDRGLLVVSGTRPTGRRPEQVYRLSTDVFEDRGTQTAQEAEGDRLPEWARRGVVAEVVKQLHEGLVLLDRQRDIFRELASRLQNEDPRELLVAMARWLSHAHADAVRLTFAERAAGRRDEAERSERRVVALENLALRLYNQQLGVPGDVGGPFRVRANLREGRDDSILDEPNLRNALAHAVLGKTVLEKVSFVSETPKMVAGTDASHRDIRVRLSPNTYPTPPPIYLMTAIGVRFDFIDLKTLDIPDVSPDPSTWLTYTQEQAVREGLIIPPSEALNLDESILRHTVEAAMNLRQYKKDLDVFAPDRRTGALPSVVFRDGRIFPLEHRFQDYIQPGFHGQMVKAAIAAFGDVFARASIPNAPVYCGVVKNPVVEAFGPLVFWYAKYGDAKDGRAPCWPEMEEDYIFKRPLPDQLLAMHLFGFLGACREQERWVTFRWVRRFSSMLEDYLARKWIRSGESWLTVLQTWVNEHDTPFPPDLTLFATLCERAAVVAFFADLGPTGINREDVRVPRYEFLLPLYVSAPDAPVDELLRTEVSLTRKVLGATSDRRALQPYDDFMGTDAPTTPLLVPAVIRHAHEIAKDVGTLFHEEFEGILMQVALRYLEEDRRRGGSRRS